MVLQSLRAKFTIGFITLIALAIGVLWYAFSVLDKSPVALNTSTTENEARAQYAELYQASWRADQGIGNVLMTATLMLPEMIQALGNDATRTDSEDQLYRAVRDTTSSQLAFIIATVSTIGPIASDPLIQSLGLVSDPTQRWVVSRSSSLIVPSAAQSGNIQTLPQQTVVIFESENTMNLRAVTRLTLTSRAIGDQDERSFVWVNPGLLSSQPDNEGEN